MALLGCGNVGTEVAGQLIAHADDIANRVGAPVELAGIAVRRQIDRPGLDPELFTTDAAGLVARDDIDIVVEVIGGIEPARSLILSAIEHGHMVVTANKALLAEDGPKLFDAAEAAGVDLYYEAAVAGAIPIIRPLRESLVGDEVTQVMGIVNGTTNFILDKMHTEGAGFDETLAEAQELGYAEADPTADIEGYDAAAKAAILAGLAFHTRVNSEQVHREGITRISRADVASAKAMDSVIKLLAICDLVTADDGAEQVSVRVHPAMIPNSHPLATVGGAFNAVFVRSKAAGELMFYGPGAGGAPTASAVLGDLVTVARHRVSGSLGPGESNYAARPVVPISEAVTRYHVSLDVHDQPGVLAAVAGAFAANEVSLQAVRQEGLDDSARLVIVTHAAREANLAATVAHLRELDGVRGVNSVMRVEGD
ncbi:MAG: homoserine dehydrogenase [Propionibacterium sp.]|nr:homoserine dehydrogenase [Propionibacterium sp.]